MGFRGYVVLVVSCSFCSLKMIAHARGLQLGHPCGVCLHFGDPCECQTLAKRGLGAHQGEVRV